ncbi:MAG TPA: GntR family transcriptional regulator, partial [Gemmatimonadales bacterium]
MFDNIDPRSPTPIYDQIAGRVKVAVASGELRPGEALPSVRQLAARIRVNPATVVQAYRELETQGFVEMRQGAGTYVREVASDRRAKEQVDQATRLVRAMMAEAGRLG